MPIHCGHSPTRGVEIYSGDECIARAVTIGEAEALALALLMGPQKINGTWIRPLRLRRVIAHHALSYIVEGGPHASTAA